MAQRSILYADVVTAAGKVATIMCKGRSYQMTTNGGSTAAVRKTGAGSYEIALPSIPATVRLSRAEADFILGLLVHELGHVRYTSFNFPKDNTRELHDLANSLEDCREEKAVMDSQDPPNGAKLLAEVTETMSLRAKAQGGNPWPIIPPGAATSCAVVTLGRLANPQYGPLPATTAYASTIPANVAALVNRFMGEITSTRTTDECFDLARRMLKEANKVLPPPVERGKAKDEPATTEAGTGKADDGESTGEAPSPTGEPGEGEGEAGGDAKPEDEPQAGKGGKSGEGATTGEPPVFDPAAVLAEMLKPRVTTSGEQMAGRFAATIASLDAEPHRSEKGQARAMGPRPGLAKQHRANVNTAGLSPKVRQMLHSQDDSMTTRYETRGRLDRRAIARTCTGDPRVFTKRSLTDGIRTGVAFLLDMSSSMTAMGKDKAQAASAIALGDACERAGADVAVWGFGPSPSGFNDSYSTRLWGGVLLPFKTWDEKMTLGGDIIAGADSPHGTNLCPAIVAASRELAARTGLDKRILMVLTDGDCRLGRDTTKATAEFCAAKYGVIIVGVGILTDVSDAFAKGRSVTVRSPAKLAGETMTALLKAVG